MTDKDIEEIIDEAFYLRNTPWVKKVCPKGKNGKDQQKERGNM